MNSAVVIQIEYKFTEAGQFTHISYTGFSASISEARPLTFAGSNMKEISVAFRIPKCDADKDLMLEGLCNRKAIYRLTDANGSVYLLGNDNHKARFSFTRSVDGKPGGFNGYECVITFKHILPSLIS